MHKILIICVHSFFAGAGEMPPDSIAVAMDSGGEEPKVVTPETTGMIIVVYFFMCVCSNI